jgi:hypothetical protein
MHDSQIRLVNIKQGVKMLEGSKGLIAKNFENKQKEKSIENLNRNMKSVDTYGNGTTGYRIKNGVNAGKVVGHIQRVKSEI